MPHSGSVLRTFLRSLLSQCGDRPYLGLSATWSERSDAPTRQEGLSELCGSALRSEGLGWPGRQFRQMVQINDDEF